MSSYKYFCKMLSCQQLNKTYIFQNFDLTSIRNFYWLIILSMCSLLG